MSLPLAEAANRGLDRADACPDAAGEESFMKQVNDAKPGATHTGERCDCSVSLTRGGIHIFLAPNNAHLLFGKAIAAPYIVCPARNPSS